MPRHPLLSPPPPPPASALVSSCSTVLTPLSPWAPLLQVLIADFFFIMLSLAWLAAGLAEKAAFKSETLIGSWMPLWPMVFQPAIGVLMAGALVSGGIAWVQENWGKKE